jgi:hypothetical protein
VHQLINRRRFFERAKALVVGGMCPAWVGGIFAADAVAAEQCERLPAFEFLGHRIGDGQETFPEFVADAEWRMVEYRESWVRTSPNLVSRGGTPYTIGTLLVPQLLYQFKGGRLSSVEAVFAEEDLVTVREMLAGRYGEPRRCVGRFKGTSACFWLFREGILWLDDRVFGSSPVWLTLYPYVAAEPPDQELRALGRRTF